MCFHLLIHYTVRLNKIKTFKMPQKKRILGFENISKMSEKNVNPNSFHRDLFVKTHVL